MQFAKRPNEVRNVVDSIAAGDVVVGARPTTPTRLTLRTPSESGLLTIGAKKGESESAAAVHAGRATEAGWSAQSDRHGHLYTRELSGSSASPESRPHPTLLSVGKPSVLDPHEQSLDGEADDKAWPRSFAESVRGDTKNASAGHAVFTTGVSYQYAEGTLRIVSTEGNVVVRTRKERPAWLALHADHGDVHVAANHDASIGSRNNLYVICSDQEPLPDPGHEVEHEHALSTWMGGVVNTINTVAGGAVALAGALSAFHHAKKWKFESLPSLPAWGPSTTLYSKIGLIALGVIAKAAGKIAGWKGWEQTATIYADHDVRVTGAYGAEIFGGTTASLASTLFTSVSGLYASLGGTLFGSASGGLGMAVNALKDVEVESYWGKTTVAGGFRGVEVCSAQGPACLAGQRNVEVKSIGGKTFVTGTLGAFVGAGTATGFGLQLKPFSAKLGWVTPFTPTTAAQVEEGGVSLAMDPLGSDLNAVQSKLSVRVTGVTVDAPMVTLKSKTIAAVKGDAITMIG